MQFSFRCCCTEPDKDYGKFPLSIVWLCRKCGAGGLDDPMIDKLAEELLDTQNPVAFAK
jgi:hypothetical protein